MQKIEGLKLYLNKICRTAVIALAFFAGVIFCCGFTHTVSEGEKYEIKLLSSYTTYFDGENGDRSHNIRLAASYIGGRIIKCGDVFSFNAAVGSRTKARGFRRAKIIENGEFVEGTGGGVCQVSTTLYNAALLSGCKIVEYHPHSLAVSYVPPSRDAMVSGTVYDLKFANTTGGDIYIYSSSGENYVRFDFYGRDFGARFSLVSLVTGTIAPSEEYTDDETCVRSGRDGTVSECYLTAVRGGVSRTVLLRRDKYAPQKRVVYRPETLDDTDIPQNILP